MKIRLLSLLGVVCMLGWGQTYANEEPILEIKGDAITKGATDGIAWTLHNYGDNSSLNAYATLSVSADAASKLGLNYDKNLFSITFDISVTQSDISLTAKNTVMALCNLDINMVNGNPYAPDNSYRLEAYAPHSKSNTLAEGTMGVVCSNPGYLWTNSPIEPGPKVTYDDSSIFAVPSTLTISMVFGGGQVSAYYLKDGRYVEIDTQIYNSMTYGGASDALSAMESNGFNFNFGEGRSTAPALRAEVTGVRLYNGDATKMLPEPGTTTLSLLAIAGWVVRRRRRS